MAIPENKTHKIPDNPNPSPSTYGKYEQRTNKASSKLGVLSRLKNLNNKEQSKAIATPIAIDPKNKSKKRKKGS